MLANREIDLQVAKKLFTFVTDPDSWSLKEETWYWVHPRNGILIGHPYTFKEMEGNYAHQWEEFSPSSDYNHTIIVLEYFHQRNKSITITNTLNMHGTNWFVKIDQGKYFEHRDLSMAVCKVVLDER